MTETHMTRRTLLAGGAASLLLAGCADPFPARKAESLYPPIGEFVVADGLRVHAWSRGAGHPVVLIHGASGNLRDWTFDLAPRLAANYRIVAFDRPGLGYTDRPPERGWDPSVQAAVLRRATEDMQIERPIVVGHSLGAAVALAWALDVPDSVSGVIAVSGTTVPYRGFGRVVSALGLSSVVAALYTEYMKAAAEDGGVERFVQRIFRPQTPPPGYIDYVGAPLALRARTLDANAEDIEHLNDALVEMAPRYATFAPPLEIIHGAADFIDPEQHAAGLHAAVPGSTLRMLPDIGHMAHHAAPDALEAALGRLAKRAA